MEEEDEERIRNSGMKLIFYVDFYDVANVIYRDCYCWCCYWWKWDDHGEHEDKLSFFALEIVKDEEGWFKIWWIKWKKIWFSLTLILIWYRTEGKSEIW